MQLRRTLLAPVAGLYGAVLRVRHALYDRGLLRSVRPAVPTIAIGNLALGGTGKTPMMELVLRTLQGMAPLATLSRGYGRSTRSIHEVGPADTAERSGDEPVQVKRNFPEVRVFVGADRPKAIARIVEAVPGVRVVVLDDALQHRRLQAGMYILLTTNQRPYVADALFPAGGLRDVRARARAARMVVVTKCPSAPTPAQVQAWRERLGLLPEQELFFSGIAHEEVRMLHGAAPSPGNTQALLFTGIADPGPLVDHLRQRYAGVEHVAFADHHAFSAADLQGLAERFHKFAPGPKILITTEKDIARLRPVIPGGPLDGLPLGVVGMRAVILNDPQRFEDLIRHHVGTHQAHC